MNAWPHAIARTISVVLVIVAGFSGDHSVSVLLVAIWLLIFAEGMIP